MSTTKTKTKTPSTDYKAEVQELSVDLFNDDTEIDALKALLDKSVVIPVVGSNSAKLKWPQDRTGKMQEFRRGAVRAIGRLGANDKDLEAFIETAAIAMGYAKARVAERKVEMVKARKLEATRVAKEIEARKVELRREVNAKKRQVAILQAEIDATK